MISLDELEALEKAATPGDWAWQRSGKLKRVCAETAEAEYYGTNSVISTFASQPLSCKQADRDLIAASRNALPLLLTELRAARAAVKAARDIVLVQYDFTEQIRIDQHDALQAAIAAYDASGFVP